MRPEPGEELRHDYPYLDDNTQTADSTAWVCVVDGAKPLPEHTRTVIIGQLTGREAWTDWDGEASGDVALDILLRCDTHELRRTVLLPRYGAIELPVAAYTDLTVWARDAGNESTTLPPEPVNTQFRVTYSEEYANPARRQFGQWFWRASTAALARRFAVPYGARRVWATVADSGFKWFLSGGLDTQPIPQSLTPLVPYDVIGTRFEVSGANQVLIWEIEL